MLVHRPHVLRVARILILDRVLLDEVARTMSMGRDLSQ